MGGEGWIGGWPKSSLYYDLKKGKTKNFLSNTSFSVSGDFLVGVRGKLVAEVNMCLRC